MTDTPALLDAADQILRDADLVGAHWLRASGLLYRSALEESLSAFWAARARGVQYASKRAQLACLTSYVEPELARQVTHAWGALSEITHHRTDLGPHRDEVVRLGALVRSLVDALANAYSKSAV